MWLNVSMVATEEEASPQQQNWQGEEESWYASGDADVYLHTPDVCYTVGLCAAVDFLLGVAGILIDSILASAVAIIRERLG